MYGRQGKGCMGRWEGGKVRGGEGSGGGGGGDGREGKEGI